jgi:hypothetical protein
MKKNVDRTLLQRIQDLKAKEIDRPKMSLEDVDVIEDPEYNSFNINKKGTNHWVGNFGYRPARIDVPETGGYVELPDFITMDMPYLEQPYRRRGIGEQMYKKIEEATGKKILPDVDLSDYSAALHSKKGMGKSFGKAEYGPDIIKSLTEKLNKLGLAEPEKAAKKAFEAMKKTIKEKGVSEFKSVAPMLVKGAGAVATGGLSLLAEAADAEEEGSKLEEEAMQREFAQRQREDKMRKILGDENASQAIESIESEARPKKYKKLKELLK